MRFCLLFMLILCSGCPSTHICPAAGAGDRAEAIWERYRKPYQTLKAIRGQARIDMRGDKGRLRGTALFLVTAEGDLRFDVMTQFGPVLTLTANTKTLALSDFQSGRFFRGPPCARALESIIGVHLTPQQLARVLMGAAPTSDQSFRERACHDTGLVITVLPKNAASPKSDGAGGERLKQALTFYTPGDDRDKAISAQRVWLAHAKVWRTQSKAQPLTIDYEDHTSLEGASAIFLPRRMHVKDPTRDVDMLIKLKEAVANPKTNPTAFRQQPEQGTQTESLLCDEPIR